MSELLSQLITPEIQMAFTVVVVLLVILYILSIVWVARDAYLRGTYWYVWGIVALVPLVGVIAYCLLRPPLLLIDRDRARNWKLPSSSASSCTTANARTAAIPSRPTTCCARTAISA